MELPTQIFLYGLALSIVALSLTVGYLITLHRKTITDVYKTKKDERIKLANLVNDKANKIIEILSADLEKKLMADLESVVTDSKALFARKLENVTDAIGTEMLAQTKDVGRVLHQQALGIEEGVRKVVEEKYKVVETEIADYKTKKLAEIDKKAGEILKEVFSSALTDLSIKDHEKLVLTKIENAKRQKLL